MFVNGDLKGKFIMDRNLGARDTSKATDGKGSLLYEFGRKDPIAGGFIEGSSISSGYNGRGDEPWNVLGELGPTTMANAVNNPMTYYTTDYVNWCDGVESATYIWLDFETDTATHGKSIFDPSPKGWKVMSWGTLDGFDFDTFLWDSELPGRSYSLDGDNVALYPTGGLRQGTTANYGYDASGFIWSSTPSSATFSYRIWFRETTFVLTDAARSAAMNIRPVQHDE